MKVPAFFRGKAEDREMGVTDYFPFLCEGEAFSPAEEGIDERAQEEKGSCERSQRYCISLPIVSSPFGRFII